MPSNIPIDLNDEIAMKQYLVEVNQELQELRSRIEELENDSDS